MQSDSVLKTGLVLFGIVVACFTGISPANTASFSGLGDLTGRDFDNSAYGVSADGSAVVGESSSRRATGWEAFLWNTSDGIVVDLGDALVVALSVRFGDDLLFRQAMDILGQVPSRIGHAFDRNRHDTDGSAQSAVTRTRSA